jgi:hypothetical protein
MQDSGMFQCVADNEAGESSTYTWLRVKSKLTYLYLIVIKYGYAKFAQISVNIT